MTRRRTIEADQPPSEAVYTAVATLEGCSPLELAPLAETLDPEALDALLASGSATVHFEYFGYAVTVTRDRVHVEPA